MCIFALIALILRITGRISSEVLQNISLLTCVASLIALSGVVWFIVDAATVPYSGIRFSVILGGVYIVLGASVLGLSFGVISALKA